MGYPHGYGNPQIQTAIPSNLLRLGRDLLHGCHILVVGGCFDGCGAKNLSCWQNVIQNHCVQGQNLQKYQKASERFKDHEDSTPLQCDPPKDSWLRSPKAIGSWWLFEARLGSPSFQPMDSRLSQAPKALMSENIKPNLVGGLNPSEKY